MRGLTNEIDQNCTIPDLKGNFIYSARHITVKIPSDTCNHATMKQPC